MFVFDSRVSTRTRTVTDDLCGCSGRAAISPDPRFEVRELGEIDMVSRRLATLDLATHDVQPAFPAVHLESHPVLSHGELAGFAGESGRVPRHDSKALVLRAGGRDLAYLAAMRRGYADRLSGPLVAIQDSDGSSPSLFLIRPDNGHAGPLRTAGAMAAAYFDCAIGTAVAYEVAARPDEPPDTGTGFWLDEPPRQLGAWPTRYAICPAGQR
jgi:hypothetical protein